VLQVVNKLKRKKHRQVSKLWLV